MWTPYRDERTLNIYKRLNHLMDPVDWLIQVTISFSSKADTFSLSQEFLTNIFVDQRRQGKTTNRLIYAMTQALEGKKVLFLSDWSTTSYYTEKALEDLLLTGDVFSIREYRKIIANITFDTKQRPGTTFDLVIDDRFNI